jgi:hypothetical protein
MAAVAVPPLPNTALEPQMLTFPNIGRAIAGTPDFMALDLSAVETAVLARHNFNQLVGFKAELLLPDINRLHFIKPIFTQSTKSRLKHNPCRPLAFIPSKPLCRLCNFQSR